MKRIAMKPMSIMLLCSSLLGTFAMAQNTTTLRFSGNVTDTNGNGIANVVVNDGIHFVTTDSQGAWSLSSDTTLSKFVSISVPATYNLPQTDGLADKFYVSVGTIVKNNSRHNFVLEKRKSADDKFYYIAVSDPQVKNEVQLKRWKQETVPDLIETISRLKRSHEVIGVTLGDLVYDNMPLFDAYKTSLKNTGSTFFQCIGNHDFDKQYQDLHNMSLGTPKYGEIVYYKLFGPTDYSFNIGKAHVITMKNLNYVGNKKYIECLTGQQIEWLKKDLSYVPKGSLVILNMHAPAWDKIGKELNIRNADILQNVLQGYKVHVFSGHTHFFQNNEVSKDLYEHNIGAACGAWWAGWVNQCGAPNGYMIVDVDGTNVKWHYKGTRRNLNYQFKLYNKGQFTTQSSFVVANIWDWDNACRVVWYQDGKPMGDMEQFTDIDEERASQLKDRSKAVKTAHLFRAMPADGAKQIKVEFKNRFGEVYTQTINL